MSVETEYPRRLAPAVALIAASLLAALAAFSPRYGILPVDIGDGFFLVYLALHFAVALTILAVDARRPVPWEMLTRAGEMLFFGGLFLALFAYLFAANAGMDYAQRFAATGGMLQLAPDTTTERLAALARYLPLLVVDIGFWLGGRRALLGVGRSLRAQRAGLEAHGPGGPLAVLLSVVLSVLAMPSGASIDGVGALGWVALVPLIVDLRIEAGRGNRARVVWHTLLWGVLFTLLGNYWLATFSLVSLQVVGVTFFFWYLLFGGVLLVLLLAAPDGPVKALVIPLAWTGFELARSSGFIGYPWLLTAHSQYRLVPLLQLAELGGVWLVSLVVLGVNALLAEAVLAAVGWEISSRRGARRLPRAILARLRARLRIRVALPWVGGAALLFGGSLLLGAALARLPVASEGDVRIALIQQNSDPRKHEYEQTLGSLIRLSEEALAEDPDIVVWSETAFVPNIRRWSQEDPRRYRLSRLVRELLAWQESIDTWLLTGNDDYRINRDADGAEVSRDSFNATVLFDDTGARQETYHKVKLVPFTEYFPFGGPLAWVRELLLAFDVYFWTPGTERVIFDHPQMRFATPICFEDVFPGEVRAFARAGMQVIVNVSNDYWSLQEVAAQQHFVASLFRTVELRRPMVRATASGVTAHVDAWGRILATRPQYSEQYLVVDVEVPSLERVTLYERWGDWVPWTAGILAILIALAGVVTRWATTTDGGDDEPV